MISNEHPENFERYAEDPRWGARRARRRAARARERDARHVRGRHRRSTVRLDGRVPGGLVRRRDRARHDRALAGRPRLAFPAAHCVEGAVVLAPGDMNLTFKTYVRDAGDAADRGRPRRRDRGRRPRRRPLPLLPRRLRRPRELRRQPRGLRHEPRARAGTTSSSTTRRRSTGPRRAPSRATSSSRPAPTRPPAATRPATSTCRCAAARSRSTVASWSRQACYRASWADGSGAFGGVVAAPSARTGSRVSIQATMPASTIQKTVRSNQPV